MVTAGDFLKRNFFIFYFLDYKWLLSIAEAEKYNMLSILLRMTMQLPSDSAASSYVVDYLIGSIGGDGVGTNKFANGECRKRFLQLEPQHQEQFLIILKKQLECERQNGDPVRFLFISCSILSAKRCCFLGLN